MRNSLWGQRESDLLFPNQRSTDSAKDQDSEIRHLVKRRFKVEDLVLSRGTVERETFSANLLLTRAEGGQSGKNQIPEFPPTYLSVEVSGKEISLLSGLIAREIEIVEERRSSPKVLDLEKELLTLREEREDLESEIRTLKNFLMETQRPKRVS